jgi:hypothetical protein
MTAIGSRRETRARHVEAARLRGCGYSWQAISDHLGYRSRSAAQSAVERLWARDREPADMKRRALSEGLMLVKQNLFEGFAAAKAAGNTSSALEHSREIRALTDQLAKLDGLLAAQRVDVTVTQTLDESFAALKRTLRDVIDAEVVDELKGIER